MRLSAHLVVFLLLPGLLAGCLEDGEEENDDEGSFPDFPGDENQGGPIVWGERDEAVIRPGAPMDGGCVFNWLFMDDESYVYIGTAAHCTNLLERVRERDSGQMVGTVVFDSDDTPGADPRLDFSLIQLDRSSVAFAHPAMMGFEGPTGVIQPDEVGIGDLVGFYGHGQAFGDDEATRDRMGVVVSVNDTEYRANLPAVQGDSGAPILHMGTGEALGMVSRFGILDVFELELPTTDVGPLVSWILEELEKAGLAVELATLDAVESG